MVVGVRDRGRALQICNKQIIRRKLLAIAHAGMIYLKRSKKGVACAAMRDIFRQYGNIPRDMLDIARLLPIDFGKGLFLKIYSRL